MSADYFPSFFLSDPVPSSSAEVNFDTNSFLCDPKPHFNTQNIDSSSASVGSGDFSYLAPSSPSDCSLNSFDESASSAASVPRDDSMNSSISLYEPSHFPVTSLFASPRVGPSSHSLLLSPQPAQPTAAAVKTKLEVLSPRMTPAAMPVAALPSATTNVANAAAMPLSALPPSIFNMVLPLPMSGSSASVVASPATSMTALSPSPRSVSGSGSANGPVDTDTVRELLKEQGVKKQRLARKAELARMSRKRKKTRLCDLEVEVAQLKDELEKERKARKVAENCLAIAQQQARMTATAAPAQPEADQSAAAENALVEESKSLHDQLRRQLSADSKEVPRLVSEVLNVVKRRQTHTAQQIRGLSRHMTPSLQLRFIEWALAQKDAFYADNSGLWNSLFVREVGLSQEQLATLMNFRAAMQQQRAVAQEMQTAFAKFSAAFEQHNNLANESLAKFVSVFTPEQLGKFFNWVDTYGQVCVQINI